MPNPNVRNVAIIAHVDHGKTTLVDCLLQQTGMISASSAERIMDSNDLEKERGITILAKNTAIQYRDTQINIVDTPGHADFGGEVERILSMVDAVLLLVDAVDGPMPQTRFVTQKAFAYGLKPIVVVNKIDRPGSEPYRVIDEVFELFDNLGGTDEQLDFSTIYASAINGVAGLELDSIADDMTPLLDMLVDQVRPPEVDEDGPFQMQISSLDYSTYEGVIGIGRISRGKLARNQQIIAVDRDGKERKGKVVNIYRHHGLERVDSPTATAGDIICLTGVDKINISDTLCSPDQVDAMTPLTVDEPTLSMMFCVNNSPLSGKEGKYVTSRQIRERLYTESSHNVALVIEDTADPDRFMVSGRGELHLSVLIETMRREGFELAVSRPQVIYREIDGVVHEPYETLTIDIEDTHQGKVMESLGDRRGELQEMQPDGKGRVRLQFRIPSRGIMGYRPVFLSQTSGTGIMSFASDGFGPRTADDVGSRKNGVLIANAQGKAVGFALFNLQNRGRMMVKPNQMVYEGMVVGIHVRSNDLTVNPLKEKKQTNVRASGTDENIVLTTALEFTLEQALEFIDDDELVEVTPENIRVRKTLLKENERKRA
ncbi:MAG: translational GTPase TypA [Gammaproteobacteria bacterium]|nr:translational GTPase TypA [Gammaproteobacteria bacterium]MBT3694310.1 translational GTPase TypA [Gammaproteobacteria bacterium]MBT5680776.1 translational GTPase TypA [Gammaproteobacteria bacterium]MBT6025556.1 translational GTPase TypA [Gammaproteobacteria bacterium]MBT6557369.1 translational GTPase TypA [Gammaproteobacteria bacterium]